MIANPGADTPHPTQTVTDDLVSWLPMQVDEDERMARAATPGPWWHNPGKAWLNPEAFEAYDRSKGEEFVGYGESPFSGCIAATGPASHAQSMADAEHIARHNPVPALREVEFKRRILAIHRRRADVTGEPGGTFDNCCDGCGYGGICDDPNVEDISDCPELRAMGAIYTDRPGYREEWRPA